MVKNNKNKMVPTRIVIGRRICVDYKKLNKATRKDNFPFSFLEQMLDILDGQEFYCFLDGNSSYNQIAIISKDQQKTTFTCPCGTFAFKRMLFGLCNAPKTFQRCMMTLFSKSIEKFMEVFMDDFSVFGETFHKCLHNLNQIIERCEETNLLLN